MSQDLRPLCPTRCGGKPPPGMVFCAWCWRFVSADAKGVLLRERAMWCRRKLSDADYDEIVAATVRSILYGRRHPDRRSLTRSQRQRPPTRITLLT